MSVYKWSYLSEDCVMLLSHQKAGAADVKRGSEMLGR